MPNGSDELSTEERISKLKNIINTYLQNESRELRQKEMNRILENRGTTARGITYMKQEYQEKKGTEEIFEIMSENLPNLMSTTHLGSSEKTKEGKCPTK